MLSVIIATLDSERALLPTLTVLVPGAMDGLVSEVIVADGGSRDDTAAIADVAGCNFVVVEGALGLRLKTAAASARAPWLLFLRPGTVLDAAWMGDTRRFVEQAALAADAAAVFGRNASGQPALRRAIRSVAAALGAPPLPEQGLLIAHRFYDALDGHSDRSPDPERDLARRIGRRRIARLASRASG